MSPPPPSSGDDKPPPSSGGDKRPPPPGDDKRPPPPGDDKRRFAPDVLLDLFANALDPGYTDAAQNRARGGPRSPWRQRGALTLRVLTLVVTGLLIAVAYREAVAAEPIRTTAHNGLVEEVKTAQSRTDGLQRLSDQLRRDVTAARRVALGETSVELNRIREREAATGLAPVTGSGVIVRVADAVAPVDPTTGKPSGVAVSRVLDLDLQMVVNGLWAGGAEAVAINGQRLSSTATIRKAGEAILVDFRPVTSPYEVAAIGPDDLVDRFNASAAAASMRGLVERYGLSFSSRSAHELRLPAAASQTLRYARPSGDTPSASPSAGGS